MSPEHTCAGMFDTSCEACYEDQCQRDVAREELPGESRCAGWTYDEPLEWDVDGGL